MLLVVAPGGELVLDESHHATCDHADDRPKTLVEKESEDEKWKHTDYKKTLQKLNPICHLRNLLQKTT